MGQLIIEYSGTDECGRALSPVQCSIRVEAAPVPTISCPSLPQSITCEEARNFTVPLASYSNNASGSCSISGTVPGRIISRPEDGCGGELVIEYSGIDECSREMATITCRIRVDRAPLPVISCPSLPPSLSCAEAQNYNPPSAPYSNGGSGSCLVEGTVSGRVISRPEGACGGYVVIEYSGIDECGRALLPKRCSIPVDPAPLPVISCPSLPPTLTCDQAQNYIVPVASYSNGASGNCRLSGTVTGVVVVTPGLCGGDMVIEYSGSDVCGRPLTPVRCTILVEPTPSPEIIIPPLPSSIACEDVENFVAPDADYTNGATTQHCLISGKAIGVIERNYTLCGGFIKITWTTSTGCDNQAIQKSVDIPVDGPKDPVITCPPPLLIDCDDLFFDAKIEDWLNSVSAAGNCGSDVTIQNDYDIVSFNGGCSEHTGIKYVTFRAVDECGNSTLCTSTIEVVDTMPPVWVIDPLPITIECSDPLLGDKIQEWLDTQGGGQAEDWCSGVGYTNDFTSFDRNCNGKTTVTFTATDDCGNEAKASAVITIIDATDPVILNVDPDITIDCIDDSFDFSNPTVSDNCDTDIGLEVENQGTLDACAGGTIIRIWTATDECGNIASEQQRVTLRPDNMAPQFTSLLPGDITVSCDNIPDAPVIEAEDCNSATVTAASSIQIIECGWIITRSWTATDACGNSVTHSQKITVECPIEATVSESGGANCADPNGGSATVIVTNGQAPYTYLWDNGETTATANNLDNGPHTVTVTDISGCKKVLNVNIEGDFTAPEVTAVGGQLTCLNTSVTLSVVTNAEIIGWTGPNNYASSEANPTVSAPGTYIVTVRGDNGCTATGIAIVNSDTAPPSVSATGGTLTCDILSVTLSVSTTGTVISWTGPNNFSSNEVNPSVSVAGTYTVTVRGDNGCTATADAVVDSDTSKPNVSATGGTLTCEILSVTLSATTDGTIVGWTGPNGFTSSEASPTVSLAGTYTVTVQAANGCTNTAVAIVSGDTSTPSVTASGGTLTCDVTSVQLTASTSATILGWTGPNNYSSNEASPTVTVAGTYTVTVQGPNGCTASATAVVSSDTNKPSVTASGGTITCDVQSVQLIANTNATVLGWTGPNNFSSNQASPSVSTPGIYTVTVQSSNGCTATATAEVTNNTLPPTVSATGGVLSCTVTEVVLTVSTNGTVVSWTGPNNFSSNQANPTVTVPGTYTVIVRGANGCTESATAEVTSDATTPSVTANGGTITCTNTSVTLTATSDATILGWTGPNGFNSNEAAPTVSVPGTYTVSVRGANGCTASANAIVDSDTEKPSVTAGGGTLNCVQTTVRLNVASSGAIIGWTGPNNFSSTETTPTVSVPGIYTVTVRGANGCEASATAEVTSDSTKPTVTASVDGVIGCDGASVTLSASTNGTILGWTGPNGFSSNEASPQVSEPGLYTVSVQGENGCTNSASVLVSADSCTPGIKLLKRTNGADINNDPLPVITFMNGNPMSEVMWTYEVTNTSNVDLTDVVVVDDKEGEICRIGLLPAGATEICSRPGTPITGKYANIATATGKYNNQPVSDIDTSGYVGVGINVEKTADQTEICPGDEVTYTLTVRMIGGTDGIEIRNVRVNDSNLDEQLTVSSPSFIASSDVNSNGVIDFIDNNNDGNSDEEFIWQYTLNIYEDNVNIAEDMGDVFFNGDFIDMVMNTDDVSVTVNPNLCPCEDIVITDDTSNATCGEDNGSISIQVSGGDAPYAYSWSNGATSQNISNLAPGTYTVAVTDARNCVGEASFTIAAEGGVVTLEVADVYNASCAQGAVGSATVIPSGGIAPYTYAWSNGQVSQTAVNLAAATYSVVVTDSNGCATSTTVVIGLDDDCNGCIGDFAWEDLNRNGVQEADEPGISNIKVRLLTGSGQFIADQMTDENGAYKFEKLAPGDYIVEFEGPDGYAPTLPERGDNDELDSDINMATMRTDVITLGLDECNMSVDAGFFRTASLGDFVWYDYDCDGLQDDNEPGAPGVRIELHNIGDDMLASTITNADGYYSFVNLPPGEYYVKFIAPDGYSLTTANAGDNDDIDSDAVTAEGKTELLVINSGDFISNIDAGLKGSSDVALDKTVSASVVDPGQTVTFSITVTNQGSTTLSGIEVMDRLPSGYTNPVNVSDAGAAFGSTIIWTGIDLGIGDSHTVTFDATVVGGNVDGLNYKNVAEVTKMDQDDIDSTPNNDDGDQSEDDEDYATVSLSDCEIQVNLQIDHESCDRNDGRIKALVSGGLAPYTYTWSNGGTDSNINDLASGLYTLIVTDSNGCSVTVEGIVEPGEGCGTGNKIDLELIKRVNMATPQPG